MITSLRAYMRSADPKAPARWSIGPHTVGRLDQTFQHFEIENI